MTSIFLSGKSLHGSKSHAFRWFSLVTAGSDAQGRQEEDPQPENRWVPMGPSHSDPPESQGVSAPRSQLGPLLFDHTGLTTVPRVAARN